MFENEALRRLSPSMTISGKRTMVVGIMLPPIDFDVA